MRKPWLSFALLVAALLLAAPAIQAQTYGVTGSYVGYPTQCVNDPKNPTTAEWLTCTQLRAGTYATNPLYTNVVGGAVGSYNYFYFGGNWVRWLGEQMDSDNRGATTTAPWSGSFLHAFDGTNWDRVRLAPLNTTLAATNTGLQSLAVNYFWNGTAYQRMTGPALGADNVANATPAPWSHGFNYAYDGATWDRVRSYTLTDTMGATPTGVGIASFTTFYDGINYQRWFGGTGANGVGTTTPFPYTHSYLHTFHGADWDRLTSTTISDVLSATPQGIDSNAFNLFYDGTNFRRWLGAIPADNLGTAMAAPYVLSLGAFYDGTNYRRLTGETYDSAIAGTVAPLTIALNAFYDGTAGTSQYWLGGSLTSSINAPVDGPYVGSIMYGYSSTGPMYYPVKADANGIFVHQADLLPGEDSTNDWRKVRIQSVNTFAPTKTTTATVTAAETEVLASVEILGYAGYTVNIKNTGGVNSLDTTYLYVSPDGTNWTLLDTNTTNVAPGITLRAFSTMAYTDRYVKVMAAATAAVTTSADVWITARVSN
jgi:hypothetical protein